MLSERRDMHRMCKQSSISDIEVPNQEEIVIRELGFKKKLISQVISEANKALLPESGSDTIFETFGADILDSREFGEAKSGSHSRTKSPSNTCAPSGQTNLQIPSLADKWKSKNSKQTTHRNIITQQVAGAAPSKTNSRTDEDRNR